MQIVKPAFASCLPTSTASPYSPELGPHFDPPKMVTILSSGFSGTCFPVPFFTRIMRNYRPMCAFNQLVSLFGFDRRKVAGFMNGSRRIDEIEQNASGDEKYD